MEKKLARVLDPKFRENVYKSRVLGKKTVRFSESVETRTFENTLEDREARINPQWRNNLRFRRTLKRARKLLSPILKNEHRQKVYNNLMLQKALDDSFDMDSFDPDAVAQALFSNVRNLENIFPFHDEIFSNEKVTGGGMDFKFHKDIFEGGRDKQQLEFINIRELSSRKINNFRSEQFNFVITLKRILPAMSKRDLVTHALHELVEFVRQKTGFTSKDLICITVTNEYFFQDICTDYCNTTSIVEKLIEKIIQILTSDQRVVFSECVFHVEIAHVPKGGKGTRILNLKKAKTTKRCIRQIKNDDELCGGRAVIVGLTYLTDTIFGHKFTDRQLKGIQDGRADQTNLTKELCRRIGHNGVDQFTYKDFKKCEKALNVQIIVISCEKQNAIDYKGRDSDSKIYLYKQKNHFDVIRSMAALLGSSYYCEKCDKRYEVEPHTCSPTDNAPCSLCEGPQHTVETKARLYCKECNRFAYNQECMDRHKKKVCPKVLKCQGCNKIVSRKQYDTNFHKCGYGRCRNCGIISDLRHHKCFMQYNQQKGGRCNGCQKCNPTIKDVPPCSYTEKYLFFDYETEQDTGTHIPNCVCVQYFSGEKFDFETNDEFCEWLINERHYGYSCIAHYAKGFDTQFVLQYCVQNTLSPNVICNGTKIMYLEIKHLKLRIIDSYNFVAAPLASFPKTFGLTELRKGYFPHLFNTAANANYVGPIPDKQYYGYNRMKTDDRSAFIKWHNERVAENYTFNLKKERLSYCQSDVDLLRRGMMTFRKDFLDIANINPLQYITIASVCLAIYRSQFLPENSIAIINETVKDEYSKESIGWLNSFENPNIKHALNGREVGIMGQGVDGFDETTNTVYEYQGCFFHGCPDCFDGDSINPVNKTKMADLHQATIDRATAVKNAGYNFVEIYVCQWKKSALYNKFKNPEIIEALNPRDAFFGGRTECFKVKAEGNIQYIDVVSLYPTVQYYDAFPQGHPKKIYKPRFYNGNWFGFIKCKVLAPKNLYLPVLPVKIKVDG